MPLDLVPTADPRTFRLAGELDLLNAEEVAAMLEPASRGDGDLILDLSGLDFIDSSGIRALIRTAQHLGDSARLVLRAPTRPVGVVLSLVGVAKEGSRIVVEGAREPEWGRTVSRTIPASPESLAEAREFIRRRATEDSFEQWADGIVLAVSEACANAVLHSGAREVQVTWRPYADHAEVEVRDEGVFKRALTSELGGTGNRGFLLMMSLMDQISITCGTDNHPGTAVRMVKNRNEKGGRFGGPGGSATRTGRFLAVSRGYDS